MNATEALCTNMTLYGSTLQRVSQAIRHLRLARKVADAVIWGKWVARRCRRRAEQLRPEALFWELLYE